MRAPRIGKLGESAFRSLCEKAGLIVNPATDDNAGWDFVVDFPAPASRMPADRAPANLTAFVQVKATTSLKRRSLLIKLSNAMRFAQHSSACFTVLFLIEQGELRQAFLKHFWMNEIEETLRAGRRASLNGLPLHISKISMKFADTDEVAVEKLLERIETAIRDVGPLYPVLKHDFGQRVGSGEQSHRIIATFGGNISSKRLLDAMLGHGAPLEVTNLRVVETRFGLEAEREDIGGPGRITFQPEGKPCELIFRSPSGDEAIVLPSKGYAAQLPFLSGVQRGLLVKSEFAELSYGVGDEGEIQISFDLDCLQPIHTDYQIMKLSSWMQSGQIDCSVEFELGRLISGTLYLAKTLDESWTVLTLLLHELFAIYKISGWPNSKAFTVADIFRNWRMISEFVAMLTRSGAVWTYTNPNPAIPHDILRQIPSKLGVSYLDLGSVTLFALHKAPIEQIDFKGDELRLQLGAPVILKRDVLRGDAVGNWQHMCRQIAEEWRRHPDSFLREDLRDKPGAVAQIEV